MPKPSLSLFGFGKFGKLVASVLRAEGFPLAIAAFENSPEEKADAARIGADLLPFDDAAKKEILLLTAPISATEELLKTLAPQLRPGQLVLDFCSVKEQPCRWLKEILPRSKEGAGDRAENRRGADAIERCVGGAGWVRDEETEFDNIRVFWQE